MPIITAIKPQKNQKRVNIYLDGKFGFGLNLENFLRLHLKVGQHLDDEEVSKIIKKEEFQKTYEKLLKFNSLRARSEKEVTDWFLRKKVPLILQNKLFARLKRSGLIDDKKFAFWWIEQRMLSKPKSRKALIFELRMKGINREITNEALDALKIDENTLALALLEKKKYKWDSLDKLKKKQKMIEFLTRSGFSWNIANSALEKYNKNGDDKNK